MGCCEVSCNCGKGTHRPVQENLSLVHKSISEGIISFQDLRMGLGKLTVREELVEVRFKNNRKAFYRNNRGLRLKKDDRVVVRLESGYDLGTITLSGDLAEIQFEHKYKGFVKSSLHWVYRKANVTDLQIWLAAKRREREVLLESRRIAGEFQLGMHIGDVEIQGDGMKVILYYSAVGKLDNQIVIRKYTEVFNLQIEMKQIGISQSAGNFAEKAPEVN